MPIVVNGYLKMHRYTFRHVFMDYWSMNHSHRELLPKWLSNLVISVDLKGERPGP